MKKISATADSFLSGDEALAQGAYEAGVRVAASYPGTPASEILETLARFPEVDSQWSVNEKVAYEVAVASAIAGLRSLYASKHVGINVAMDPLMTSAYTGINAGFVVVTADDPGIHSSQNEQDNRLLAKAAKLPLLEPSSPAEAYDFVQQAFEISETFDTPVMLRLTTRIAHTKENMSIASRRDIAPREFKINAAKYVMVPRNAYVRHKILEERLEKLKAFAEKSKLNRIEWGSRSRGFITSSVSYLYLKEMFPDASFLKLGIGYPFPEKLIRKFRAKVKELFVIEELDPFIEEHVRLLGIKCKAKHASFRVGELRPEFIADIVRGKPKTEPDLATKKPIMCPGCPHRQVFAVLKKLKVVVTGDIGCYTLGALPPLQALHTCLCMGSGVTFLEGMQKALGRTKVVGVIGDSTFVHSGITGLVNLGYNKGKGVVIILDNGTTAMTGNQPHPGTGSTITGAATKRLVLEDMCRAAGADHVDVIDPFKVKELEQLIRQRLAEDALTVIIARAPCQLVESRQAAAPRYEQEKCTRCHLCLSIDCPAMEKTNDGYIAINTNVCTGCNLCAATCPVKALTANG